MASTFSSPGECANLGVSDARPGAFALSNADGWETDDLKIVGKTAAWVLKFADCSFSKIRVNIIINNNKNTYWGESPSSESYSDTSSNCGCADWFGLNGGSHRDGWADDDQSNIVDEGVWVVVGMDYQLTGLVSGTSGIQCVGAKNNNGTSCGTSVNLEIRIITKNSKIQ